MCYVKEQSGHPHCILSQSLWVSPATTAGGWGKPVVLLARLELPPSALQQGQQVAQFCSLKHQILSHKSLKGPWAALAFASWNQ